MLQQLIGLLGAGGAANPAETGAPARAPAASNAGADSQNRQPPASGLRLIPPSQEEGGQAAQASPRVQFSGDTQRHAGQAAPTPPATAAPTGGTLKHLAEKAKGTAKVDLRRAAAVHNAILEQRQTAAEVHERIAGQKRFVPLLTVRNGDNKVRVLHTVGRYTCPLGDEASEPHNGKTLAFSGDRVGRREPPLVEFPVELLEETLVEAGSVDKINAHLN